MNKKKALFTSLAALALAATANTSFAEEVDATVAEPVVADVPATEEVAQDAPVAEVAAGGDATPETAQPSAEVAQEEPVAEAVAEEVPAVEAPAETVETEVQAAAVAEVAAASAGEQATPAMDVQAIANGDYSSVEGIWKDGNSNEISFSPNGFSFNWNVGIKYSGEEWGLVDSKVNASGLFEERYEILGKLGEELSPYVNNKQIVYIPSGTEFDLGELLTLFDDPSPNSKPESVIMIADEDLIVDRTQFSHLTSEWGKNKIFRRELILIEEPVEEVVLTDEAIYADVLSQYKDFINSSIQQNPNTPELNASTEAAWGDIQGNVNYAFYDIDGDGRNELLITHGYDQDMTVEVFTSIDEGGYAQGLPTDPTSLRYHAGAGRIYNIYRVNDAGLVQSIFRSETRGVTSVLMEDGTIWTTGRTGTTPTAVTKYQLDATGVYVEVATYFDKEQNGNERSGIYTNTATGEQLTLDELLAQINASKAVNLATLNWTAVNDFVRPANAVTGNLTTTANPTTSEVVHVPLTAKTEATVGQATPAKPAYSRSEKAQAEKTAQSEKGILPSTGEVTSVLSALGAGLSALGLAGLRRRNK